MQHTVRSRFRPRWRLLPPLLVGLLLLSLAPVGPALAQVTPAQDGAQVVAQGIAELPGPEVAWNIFTLSAGPLDASGTLNANGQSLQNPGFLVAIGGPILTVDDTGAVLHQLNPGEAAFSPGAARLNPISQSSETVPYYAITLLPASGPNSSAGQPFFAGEAFPVTPSIRDFNLVRAVLAPGQATSLDSGEIPGLFLTVDGQLDLVTPAGAGATLAKEQAVTFAGEITITNAGSAAATFVAAVIGDEISLSQGTPTASRPAGPTQRVQAQPAGRVQTPPAPRTAAPAPRTAAPAPAPRTAAPPPAPRAAAPAPAPRAAAPAPAPRPAAPAPRAAAPAPNPNTGKIIVTGYSCGVRPASGVANLDQCTPIPSGYEAQLNVSDGSVLGLDKARRDGNSYVWEGLVVNQPGAPNPVTYIPSQPVSPPGHLEFDFVSNTIDELGVITLTTDLPEAGFAIHNFTNLPDGDARGLGTVSINVLICPEPVTPGGPPDACGEYRGGIPSLNISLATASQLYPPTSFEGATAYWADLPPGTYTLNQNASSMDYSSARFAGQSWVCCQAGAFQFTFDNTGGLNIHETLYLFFPLDTDADLLDADDDGLTDAREAELGTNPQLADTAGDRLLDGDEVDGGLNPTLADTDGDGLSDGTELLDMRTSPSAADSDFDGVSDGDEVANGSDPIDGGDQGQAGPGPANLAPAAGTTDSDDDGLSDTDEAAIGTDPFNGDTDGDGITDAGEITIYGTNPLSADTDGDGADDNMEANFHGTNPVDPTSGPGAANTALVEEPTPTPVPFTGDE